MNPLSRVYAPSRNRETFLDEIGFESESELTPRKRRSSREIRIPRNSNGPRYHVSYPASPGRRGPRNVNITLRTVSNNIEEIPTKSGQHSRMNGAVKQKLEALLERWRRPFGFLRYKVARGSPILLALIFIIPMLLAFAAFQSTGHGAGSDTGQGGSICKNKLVRFGLSASGLRFLCARDGESARTSQPPCLDSMTTPNKPGCVCESPPSSVGLSKESSVLQLGYLFPQILNDVRYDQIQPISVGLHDLVSKGSLDDGNHTLNALEEIEGYIISASEHGRRSITNARSTVSYTQALMDSRVVRLQREIDDGIQPHTSKLGFQTPWGQHGRLDSRILVEEIKKSAILIMGDITHIYSEASVASKDLKLAENKLEEFARLVNGKFLNFKAQCSNKWYKKSPRICHGTSLAEYRQFVVEIRGHTTTATKRLSDVSVKLEALKDTVGVTSLHLERISTMTKRDRTDEETLASMRGIIKSCENFVGTWD